MNILHHKSWHVRNKDNIEKVRRDEREAKEKEKEEARRAALAEQEARTDFLRRKQNGGLAVVPATSKSLELFKRNDERVDNADHAEEKRAEKEKMERKMGILKYLGEGSVELQQDVDRPWYFRDPSMTKGDDEVELKRKSSLDPLVNLNHYVSLTKKKKDKKRKDKKAKRLKSKSKKKEKKESKTLSMKDLRKARLKREADEKERRNKLLNKDSGKPDEDVEMDLRNRSYNNQFLPDMIRRKR